MCSMRSKVNLGDASFSIGGQKGGSWDVKGQVGKPWSIASCFALVAAAVMLDLTFFLRILYASQSVGFIVKQAYFRVTFRHQLSNLCSDNMWFLVFGLGWFDRHALVENVKEKLVKRRQLIVDLVENIDSVKGGLRDVFAKGLSVKVLKTTSRYGRRNRFWTHQS